MSKNSNTEGKGFVLKTGFAVSLVAHTVSGYILFALENNMLLRERISTILYCIYNLDGSMLITSDEIADAMSERNKNIHSKYGIHGVNEPFTINSTNLFR